MSLLFLHLGTSDSQAQSIVFTEKFDAGFHQWQPLRDAGENWQIVDGQANVYLTGPHVITEMVPKDHVWSQTWQNLEYELDYTPLRGVDRNISFGVQSSRHWYEIHFVEEFFNLVKVKAGSRPFDINHPFQLKNGQTYRIKITFHTGLIQVFVDGRLIAEEYDATFNQDYGKVGIKVTTGDAFPTHVRFDNITVKHITDNGFQLNVPLIKQNDPIWSEHEYDRAHDWSNEPSFRRWACALTSMVMILQYHGLHHLPNNEPITPVTLNQWLLDQPDGYVGEGLLNWVAISRLTQLISQKFDTPKLEFSFKNQQPYQAVLTELAAGRPSILQIPGHFLVATGHPGNKQDLFINDPYYDYQTFFAHQQDLQSIRTFVPSQTDLSYIVLAYPSSLQLKITDTAGQALTQAQTSTEFLTSSDSRERNKSWQIVYLAKPDNQEIIITIKQASVAPFSLNIFSYDTQGNLTDLSQAGLLGPQPLAYKVIVEKDTTPSLMLQSSWPNLQQHLLSLSQTQKHLYYTTFLELNQIVEWAKSDSITDQLRYTKLFLHTLEAHKVTLTNESHSFLQKYVQDFGSGSI